MYASSPGRNRDRVNGPEAISANGMFFSLLQRKHAVLTTITSAKVYITGRRMEALANAARKQLSHSGESSGFFIPIGPCDATSKKSPEDLVSQVEAKEKYLSLVVAAVDAVQMKKNLWHESAEDLNTTTTQTSQQCISAPPLSFRCTRLRRRATRRP